MSSHLFNKVDVELIDGTIIVFVEVINWLRTEEKKGDESVAISVGKSGIA